MADEKNSPVRSMVFKASVLGANVDPPQASQDETRDQIEGLFRGTQVITPPLDPVTLLRIWENSGALNQNVEAYMTNIDGLGHRLESVYDFDAPDIMEQVREAMWAARDALTPEPVPLPSDTEVKQTLDELKRRSRLEKARLTAFLENANPNGSFITLRRDMRQNLELLGNAYWEVLRNKAGRLARFVSVPAINMRLTSIDDSPTKVIDRVAGPLGFTEVVQYRFFRRYVQVFTGRNRRRDDPTSTNTSTGAVWFKDFGDPRIVSRNTGKVYPDLAAFEAAKQRGDMPATEMFHFKLPRPGEAYGMPRWIGNLLAVLGSRAADEVNFDYFDNKAIPPLALLVQGGRLGEDSVSKIETYIRDNLKGRSNFHKILIIEATPTEAQQLAGDAAVPRLAFQPLGELQKGDALFQNYDERNIDKIGSSFRLPRLMRGDVRDFNRATAYASLRFAEEQVFQPERQVFDAQFNRRILPALDVALWRFRSNGHRTRDPEIVTKIANELVRRGVLTPNEGRDLASDVLGKTYEPIMEDWARQPLAITLSGMRMSPDTTGGTGVGSRGSRLGEAGEMDVSEQELRALANEANRLAATRDSMMDPLREEADNEEAEAALGFATTEESDEP